MEILYGPNGTSSVQLSIYFLLMVRNFALQIVRFQDKESHQIFLEPEGRTVPELYVQVLSALPLPGKSFVFFCFHQVKIAVK